MATNADFERDFAALCQDCYECWNKDDLQLAAELGKTLLERNKELENSLKQCQNVIDEQTQEIEYLTKQTTALRKTNDNRIRIYEQLEVSIQELERANQRLALDNATDKKQIKSLCAYRDTLESRCEELQKSVDEARLQQTLQKEKLRKFNSTKDEIAPESPEPPKPKSQIAKKETNAQPPKKTEPANNIPSDQEDLVNQLLIQIQELKSHRSRDQRKITDLEEEICRRTQDMALLEEELTTLYQREEHVKNLQEEISALEEVRSGHLCGRCLKEIDSKLPQEVQMLLDPEEESTVNEKFYNDIHLEIKEVNPYRTLVEKYEAIMEEQSKNRRHSRDFSKSNSSNCLSLQDELKMYGELNSFNKDPEEEDESGREDNEETQIIKNQRTDNKRKVGKRKMFSTTPTDFSEAETSSSGFSDETSNKSTQTERNLVPGSFLCSIADGEDCKFSIYDDACPIESRFRKTPEYRTLFKEIFAVLKRAAEAKEEGDRLPLLDDITPLIEVPKVPPVTPAKEDVPDFEDLQSLPESLNMSEAASETSSILDPNLDQTLRIDVTQPEPTENQEPTAGPSDSKKDKKQTNDILEYLSIGIGVKKKNKKRHANSPARKLKVSEIVEKIEGSAPNSPRRSARRRKQWNNYDSPRAGNSRNQSPAVQPRVLTTLERKESSPSSSSSVWGTQTFLSKAAQEVAQLKKLEKSYAEVLRHTPKSYISKRKSVTSPIV